MPELLKVIENGANSTIGVSAQKVRATNPRTPLAGFQIKAGDDNSASIYLGGSDVTVKGTNDDTDGMEFAAGASMFFPIQDLSALYAISDSPNQRLEWICC